MARDDASLLIVKEQVKVESAVVDSGASTSVFGVNIEQDMLEKQASTRTFSGFASGVTRMASRDGHVTVLVLGEDGRNGRARRRGSGVVRTGRTRAQREALLGRRRS